MLEILQTNQEIHYKLDNTDYFLHLAEQEDFNQALFSLGNFNADYPFEAALKNISVASLMSIQEINQVILAIEFCTSHKKHLKQTFERWQICSTKLLDTCRDFRAFVETDGEINFLKHPKLRGLFTELNEVEQKIRSKLNRIIKDSDFVNNLQITEYDVVNDYYVLPVKNDHYQTQFGKIIGRSESGKTLFVEPSSITKDNAERLGMVLEIEKIINQIEMSFVNQLRENYPDVSLAIAGLLHFDEFQARARFVIHQKYHKPNLASTPIFSVKKAFHPLIPSSVPNDIQIDSDKGLIISGPNTGGKTATLKLIALYINLVKRGFFLPALEASVYPFQRIFYLGQDQQSLKDGLSSFASEVQSYIGVEKSIGKSNLILIDEIFSSTASEEASALAYSLLKHFMKFSNTSIVVSTHHQTLKQYLHNDESFVSAHVGFNAETNQPTYKLIYGNPGSSYALEIFEEMAKDSDSFSSILNRARGSLDTNIIHYEKMLSELSRKQHKLEMKIQQQEKLNKDLQNQKNAQEAVFQLKMQERLSQFNQEIMQLKEEALTLVAKVKRGEISNSNKIAQKFHRLTTSNSSPPSHQASKGPHSLDVPDTLKVGEVYFCTQINSDAKLISINKKRAKIQNKNMKIEVPITSLRCAINKMKHQTQSPRGHIHFAHKAKLEIDCRGMRLSEFQTVVDQALSDLYLQQTPFVTIIHGHGDGVLKKWLRRYIASHPDFRIGSNETGNDGETRIELV